jgi:hypothetical protein
MKSAFAILLLMVIPGLSQHPLKTTGTAMSIFLDIQWRVFQKGNINVFSPPSVIISAEHITNILQVKVTDKAARLLPPSSMTQLFYCTGRSAS